MSLATGQGMLAEALSHYSFNNPKAVLIRHNENITYKITEPGSGEMYQLRIHKPTEGFSLGIFGEKVRSVEYIQSEMDIIEDLGKYSGITVQEPVINNRGRLVTELSDGTPATVLSWIPGKELGDAEISGETYKALGRMTGEMHEFLLESERKYSRFSYDQGLLPAMEKRINEAGEGKYFDKDQISLLISSLKEMEIRLDEMDRKRVGKCITHADLSKSNLIMHNGRIIPIDFSLCGYSHFYMDLGGFFGHITDDENRVFLVKAYEEASGQKINPSYIEPYFIMSILLFLSCQYTRTPGFDWFKDAMSRWCDTFFSPFVEKKAFLMK